MCFCPLCELLGQALSCALPLEEGFSKTLAMQLRSEVVHAAARNDEKRKRSSQTNRED